MMPWHYVHFAGNRWAASMPASPLNRFLFYQDGVRERGGDTRGDSLCEIC